MSRYITASPLVLLLLSACGSAGSTNAPSDETSRDNVINGTPTDDQPAIGLLNTVGNEWCTGTLIAPKVVLTAAHCFNFDDSQSGLGSDGAAPSYSAPTHGSFKVTNTSQSPATFSTALARFAVFSKELGKFDLAVVELDQPVPDNYATPLDVHVTGDPRDGETVRVYGEGCTSATWNKSKVGWDPGPGFGQKRYADAPYNRYDATLPGNTTCPGDSGGPVIDSDGDIIGVVSGSNDTYDSSSKELKSTVDMIAEAWGQSAWIYNMAVLYGGRSTVPKTWLDGRVVGIATPSQQYDNSTDPKPYYLTFDGSGNLSFTAKHIDRAQTFWLVSMGGPYWAIRSQDGYFVSAEGQGGGDTHANRDVIGPWETFVIPNADSLWNQTIGTLSGYYMSAVNNGGSDVNFAVQDAQSWEHFDFVPTYP